MISLTPSTYENNIIVPMAVLPPAIAGIDPQLVCPSFILPVGHWTLVFNLVTIFHSQLARAIFPHPPEKGILPMPEQGLDFLTSTRTSDTQWTVSFVASSEERMRPFFYDVHFIYPAPPEKSENSENTPLYKSSEHKVIRHDPTIVIAHDPVEPPTSGTPDLRVASQTMET